MRHGYRTMPTTSSVDRRGFVRVATAGAAAVGGLVLGVPAPGEEKPAATETNVDDFLKVPRTRLSLPGLFPGRVEEGAVFTSIASGLLEARERGLERPA